MRTIDVIAPARWAAPDRGGAAAAWQVAGGRLLPLDCARLIGVLNVTPDSFSDGGEFSGVREAVAHARRLLDEGACIIDIGGESVRPGARRVRAREQIARVVPVIRGLRRETDALISIDTTRSDVAEAALAAGADIINDVSAGTEDERMLPLAVRRRTGLILMHRLRPPEADSYSDRYLDEPVYDDVVATVRLYLLKRVEAAVRLGIHPAAVVIDPGLGFGKSVSQSYRLIATIGELVATGHPVLSAVSRKSLLGAVTGVARPRARVIGSTAVSVILSGLLLKMGAYGFLRFCLPMLPEASAAFAPFIMWLSVLAILYGGAMALAQHDFKRLIAYSSIAHMGFVTLGIFGLNNQGIQGAVLQMVNHGITTGALFLVAGMLYDRTHDRTINNYGGLHQVMPRFAVVLSIFTVASFGLPGTGNFIGEFLVLVGTLSHSYLMIMLVLAGIVLGASYMLGMFQRLVLGPVSPQSATLHDLNRREMACVIPLALAVFVIGLYPSFMLDLMDASVTTLVQDLAQVQPLRMAEVWTAP